VKLANAVQRDGFGSVSGKQGVDLFADGFFLFRQNHIVAQVIDCIDFLGLAGLC
jgi:hypothetical protein